MRVEFVGGSLDGVVSQVYYNEFWKPVKTLYPTSIFETPSPNIETRVQLECEYYVLAVWRHSEDIMRFQDYVVR